MAEKQNQQDNESLYFKTLKHLSEGEVVYGKIVAITGKEVLVDVGYKSEGAISITEFSNPDTLKVGDTIEVYIECKENDEGMVVLSKKKAERSQGWERFVEQYKEGDVVEGKVTKKVKGGLVVDIGIDAFLPTSLIAVRGYVNPGQTIGQVLKFRISKIDKERKNVILSRRDYLIKEKELSKQALFSSLKVGDIRKGTVKNITDFGAFIDIGGIDGLLHVSDMRWGRVTHPSEILTVSEKIDVMVLEVDKNSMKVSLGLKQTTPNPWQNVETKYPVGTKVKGKVINLMPYGAFIEIEKGLEGLVHISELSWTRRVNHPSEILAVGDIVEAVILNVDSANQKLSLGIKQAEINPWVEVANKYPPGTKVKGKIRNIIDYGAFVEIEEGLDGLLHASDISWTKRIANPQDFLKKGEEIEAMVLWCDPKERKLSLGLKQFYPNPWPEISARYQGGSIVEGKVTGIMPFGLFVELDKDLEGLVHISEIPNGKSTQKLDESYKIGDSVKVTVLKVDEQERKIALSMKGV